MKTIKMLLAVAALSTVSSAVLAADDSAAALRVQQSLSQPLNTGSSQQMIATQATFAESGMSVAAGRLQQSLSTDLQGTVEGHAVAFQETEYMNNAGKSVSATRVEQSINESV